MHSAHPCCYLAPTASLHLNKVLFRTPPPIFPQLDTMCSTAKPRPLICMQTDKRRCRAERADVPLSPASSSMEEVSTGMSGRCAGHRCIDSRVHCVHASSQSRSSCHSCADLQYRPAGGSDPLSICACRCDQWLLTAKSVEPSHRSRGSAAQHVRDSPGDALRGARRDLCGGPAVRHRGCVLSRRHRHRCRRLHGHRS